MRVSCVNVQPIQPNKSVSAAEIRRLAVAIDNTVALVRHQLFTRTTNTAGRRPKAVAYSPEGFGRPRCLDTQAGRSVKQGREGTPSPPSGRVGSISAHVSSASSRLSCR